MSVLLLHRARGISGPLLAKHARSNRLTKGGTYSPGGASPETNNLITNLNESLVTDTGDNLVWV